MRKVKEKAFAKVNIGLKVFPKKEGATFHNILSVFHTIDLFDTLTVWRGFGRGKIKIVCNEKLPPDNTLTKAYFAFEKVLGFKPYSVKVKLEKKIPSGAGLGGGSADAAALLRAMVTLNAKELLEKRIAEAWLDEEIANPPSLQRIEIGKIAGLIGSDVFFFCALKDGFGAALVEGRGDRVKILERRGSFFLVLVTPSEKSSTQAAYKALDEEFSKNPLDAHYPLAKDLQSMYTRPIDSWTIGNDFEKSISKSIPSVQRAIELLKKSGASYTSLSGSGSCVFGVYKTSQAAQKALSDISTDGFVAQIV